MSETPRARKVLKSVFFTVFINLVQNRVFPGFALLHFLRYPFAQKGTFPNDHFFTFLNTPGTPHFGCVKTVILSLFWVYPGQVPMRI